MRIDAEILRQSWFLAGPTACGKTATALLLAERLNAEIIALDSMSLYRMMDIGTAKPTPEERARVPHHLIDVIGPHEEFSVAEYVRAAEAACREILDRGHLPLFVGGTGLYLRALLRGVFDGPPADETFRSDLQEQARVMGGDWLHQQVRSVDPDAAARLHSADTRRLIRVLEIVHLTGRPASQQQRETPLSLELRPKHVYWLNPPRAWLHARINHRVQQMMAAGWLEEVRALLNRDRPLSRTARQALGYQELIAHLHGEGALDVTIDRIQTRTRQFAKRQHTWFRHLEECRAVEITGEESPHSLVETLLSDR
ncbi:MAG: tRNA (adenosine(37)-N6)-dimethylallyltransferase MiaA [Planctomycetaceae bacterium]|nr:tRNA (adenosine(37)-N6)-dimethylallyltransferase MiaA [Planctomycetaceae bacterium]